MRPKNKGWIKNYAEFLEDVIVKLKYGDQFAESFSTTEKDLDKNFYRLIQPTGLMYGHPLQPPGNYNLKMNYWDESEKLSFILLDSFIHNSYLIRDPQNKNNIKDLVYHSVKELIEFYQATYPNINIKEKDFFGKKKSEIFIAESLIQNRIKVRSGVRNNFWAGFFYNSLLFLDVYFYGIWIQKKDGIVTIDDFEEHQEQLRLSILKIIASASQADNTIDYEEKKLFKFFLQSAGLSPTAEKEAMEYLTTNIKVEDLEFPKFDSWLLRKYLLELAMLTVWSDKEVKELEKDYLHKLGKKLHFTDEELESSLLAIESFVITNWEQVHYLQSRHNFHIIRDRFTNRVGKVLVKNKKAVEKELKESKELMVLLKKATKHDLTDEEKVKVKTQLIDVLKTIPTFVIIALPFTFITLPLLIKMLPPSAFPSAFSDDD